MDAESILLTHAEVAVAIAGFATVVAVLQRPLSLIQRNRFFTILLVSLQQILGGLLPVWLARSGLAGTPLWRTASWIYLGLALLVGIFLIQPTIRVGGRAGFVINVPVTVILYTVAALAYAVLFANLFMAPAPGFALYYPSMVAGLISVFIVFAEVATQADDGGA